MGIFDKWGAGLKKGVTTIKKIGTWAGTKVVTLGGLFKLPSWTKTKEGVFTIKPAVAKMKKFIFSFRIIILIILGVVIFIFWAQIKKFLRIK